MSDHGKKVRLEGIVRASRYDPGAPGKQFLGATIECDDATAWVIDYEEQSPFHACTSRQVVATGEPYTPKGQHLIGWREGKPVGHFCVSSMRPVGATSDADLAEVGAGCDLRGRFERETGDPNESVLSFVTDSGEVFVVANDPAGASVGLIVKVWAYPVRPSPSIHRPPAEYLWIICSHSAADLWAWRGRRS